MDFTPPHLARTCVIEALACYSKVDVSALLELLEKTPEDFGRNAREWLSLRILEIILAKAPNANSVPCNTIPKKSLDPSELCEDVLRRVLTESCALSINRSGILKWDVGPFIEHKRSSLAKDALQQLKDAIRSGEHSSLASFREQSGLSVGNQHEHGAPIGGGSNLSGMEKPDESFMAVSKKRSTADIMGPEKSCNDQISLRNVEEINVGSIKKQKHNALNHEQNVVGELKSPEIELVTGSETLVQNNGRRLNGHDNEHTPSRAAVGIDELLPHADSELNRKCAKERDQHHDMGEAKDDTDGFCNLNITGTDARISETDVRTNDLNALEGENVGISRDSYRKCNEETDIPSEFRASDEGPCRQGSSERDQQILHQDDETHVSSDNADVVEKRKKFLSSQPMCSQDSLTATESRDLILCSKCNKGGKLLVCSSDSCSLVIHDSCLGSDSRFDLGEKFYCPFCVYSRAITNYMEIKKKAFLARKDLAILTSDGRGEKPNKHRRSESAKDNTLEKDDNGLPKCDEPNARNDVEKTTSSRSKEDPPLEQREASFLGSDKPIGDPKQEKQNTYPQLHKPRRQLLPWTTEEEDLLMEEVKRFSAAGATIPWTKILELGANVFLGRRPIDLKNKWRNTMRKAAASK